MITSLDEMLHIAFDEGYSRKVSWTLKTSTFLKTSPGSNFEEE
jgi:hypothetical protein